MTRLNVRDFGTALSFDGVNDVVNVSNVSGGVIAMWVQYKDGWKFIVNNNETYYTNAVQAVPDFFPAYLDGSDLVIGKSDGATFHKCRVDDVRTFTSLTTEDIYNIYHVGLIRGSAESSGLSGEWLFNEGSGSTAYDTSGNGNHGTITGATYTTDVPMVARGSAGTRRQVNGNLVANGDLNLYPSGSALTTVNARFADGTSGGSTSVDTFRWYTGGSGTFAAGFDYDQMYNGKPSLALKCLASGTNIELFNDSNPAITPTYYGRFIPVLPNTSYTYSLAIKTEYVSGNSSHGAVPMMYETSGALVGIASNTLGSYTKISRDWTRVTGTIVTNANTRYMNFGFRIYGHTGAANLIMSAWLADFSCTPAFPEQRTPVNGNLIRNGDFKYTPPFTAVQTSSGFIDGTAAGSATNKTFGWRMDGNGPRACRFDTTTTYNGLPSLKLSTTGVGTAYIEAFTIATAGTATSYFGKFIPVLPSTSYTLSFFMKTQYVSGNSNNGATVTLILSTGAGTDDPAPDYNTTYVKTTTDWTRYTLTITTSDTTRYIQVNPHIYGHTGTGNLIMDAWFADIQLKPTTPETRQTA